MNIGGKSQNKSARAQIKIAFVPLIINPACDQAASTVELP